MPGFDRDEAAPRLSIYWRVCSDVRANPMNEQGGVSTVEEEYYPMPAFAQLQVADLDRAAHWYAEALEFRAIFTMPGPDGNPILIHLRRSRYQDLLLVRAARGPQAERDAGAPAGAGVRLYFQFEGDWDAFDALAERARRAGEGAVEGPIDTPWNTREVRARDLDGYRVVFTKGPLDHRVGIDDIVERGRASRA